MPGLRTAGVLWMAAGLVCVGLLLVVFVGENLLLRNPGLSGELTAGAIAALVTGGLLVARPGPAVVRWSMVLGLAWLVVFGSLTVSALGGSESGPMVSSGLIAGFGIAGAIVTFLAGRFGSPSRVQPLSE
jgi:hypothetical protein